jgi:hypothetical protein
VRITPTTTIDLFGDTPHRTNIDHICLEIEPTDLDALAVAFPDSRRNDNFFGAQGHTSSLYISNGNACEIRSYLRL